MICDEITLRPRYGEVDKMGYVYHANYVSYCHHARNELLRKIGIDEDSLEKENLMLPVISFNIEYKKPAHFDEELTIHTCAKRDVDVRFEFVFEICNKKGTLLSKAESTVVFVDMKNRFPKKAPEAIKDVILHYRQ